MTNAGDDFWNYCAHCGEKLGITDWPPVVEMISDDGETIIHSFCDDECKTAWRDDN